MPDCVAFMTGHGVVGRGLRCERVNERVSNEQSTGDGSSVSKYCTMAKGLPDKSQWGLSHKSDPPGEIPPRRNAKDLFLRLWTSIKC